MLSKEEWRYLFTIIRRALKEAFRSKKVEVTPPSEEDFPHLYEKRGVFVTLYKKERGKEKQKRGTLRGCIGSIFPEKPLYEEIIEVALSSAFKDPRFPPLREEELEDVEIEISLLSPFKRVSYEEIEVG
ncbi:MAG: AmmeMemoRadiSam system protein A, partial [Caldimicrobium sp.]